MGTLPQDLRYAFRSLSKSRGFAAVVVLTLALGIGANTAIFTLIDAVMLRLLPVAHPEELVLLTDPGSSGVANETTETGARTLLSFPEFDRLRTSQNVLTGLVAVESGPGTIPVRAGTGAEKREIRMRGQLVSGEFFPLLGVPAALGRVFGTEEDRAGAAPVAVISHDFWQRELHGDPEALSRSLRAGRGEFRIIGVARQGFRGITVGSNVDAWIPMRHQPLLQPGRDYLNPRDTLWLQVMGRLKPGVTRQAAEAGLNVAFQQVLRDWAGYARNDEERHELLDQRIELRDGAKGASFVRRQFSEPLLLLLGMVGMLLLIACANSANLLLARATARQREIGIRLALGAGRARLARQLLTESLLLALGGGAAGILLALWGADLLVALVSSGAPVSLEVHHDLRVFGFTAAVSILTGIVFGLAPALRASRTDVNRTLASGARGQTGTREHARLGRLLVVAQISLSVLLLFGAALLVRSFQNLLTQKFGYDREHLLMVRVDLLAGGHKGPEAAAFLGRALDALRAVPGVRGATLSNTGLFAGDSGDQISIDAPTPRKGRELAANWDLVGPGYFRTLGIPLLRGREIEPEEFVRGTRVCVINDSMARFFFPNSNPIGHHITDEYPTTRETYEIVGVAADARQHRLRGAQERRFYATLAHPIGSLEGATFLLRTSGDLAGIVPQVRQQLTALDGNLPLLSVRTVDEQIERQLTGDRMIARLSAAFGLLAMLLAAVGVYGVMSYSVSRRTGELGVRMALGASEPELLRMVLRESLLLAGVGAAIGLPVALAAARLLRSRLFGLGTADPAAIAGALAVILAAALAAGYLPARRAAHVDPIAALRAE